MRESTRLDFQGLAKDNPSRDWIRDFAVRTLPLPSPSGSRRSTVLLDTYRYLHPEQKGAYTCWSTLLDTRKTNYGTRIDYVLSSTRLASQLTAADVWQHVRGSDHCPVFAEFECNLVPSTSKQLPALCSSWFTAKQSKLSDFMSTRDADESSRKKGSGVKRSLPKKRGNSSFDSLPPAKKSLSQKSLFSFSAVSQTAPKESSGKSLPLAPQTVSKASPAVSSGDGGSGELSGKWVGIFGGHGTRKAPLCSGHNEACVLRKVKKQGPNKDREFWVCPRPVGSKSDPQARCDYFKWDKARK